MLLLFTVVEGALIGVIAAWSDLRVVLAAVGITGVVVLALSAFALQTKYDITMMGGVLLSALVAGIAASIYGAVLFCGMYTGEIYHLVIAWILVVVFSAYLIHDV